MCPACDGNGTIPDPTTGVTLAPLGWHKEGACSLRQTIPSKGTILRLEAAAALAPSSSSKLWMTSSKLLSTTALGPFLTPAAQGPMAAVQAISF